MTDSQSGVQTTGAQVNSQKLTNTKILLRIWLKNSLFALF